METLFIPSWKLFRLLSLNRSERSTIHYYDLIRSACACLKDFTLDGMRGACPTFKSGKLTELIHLDWKS